MQTDQACLERIKQLKTAQKITNEDLSARTGIPMGTLSKILAGMTDSPKLCNIRAIADALGVTPGYLISGDDPAAERDALTPEERDMMTEYRRLDRYGREAVNALIRLEVARVGSQRAVFDLEVRAALDAYKAEARGGRAGAARARNAASAGTPASAPAGTPAPAPAGTPAFTALTASAPTVAKSSSPAPAPAQRPAGTEAGRVVLKKRFIKYFDYPVSAGIGEFLADDAHAEPLEIPDNDLTRGADYALRVNGDSMSPEYRNGDILLVEKTERVGVGELGIFILDGAGYFKRLGKNCLISLNPAYDPIKLGDYQSVSCFGRVIGVMSPKKKKA